MWEVLETARTIAAQSSFVKIDKPALIRFAQKLADKNIAIPPWNANYHFQGESREVTAYLLALDTINFCFWPPLNRPKWEIEYRSEKLSGYYGLAAALKNALESGVPIAKADYLAKLTLDELKQVLGGRGELQLLEQRNNNLNELGQMLIDGYQGEAINLVEEARGSALKLVRLLAEKISSFNDVAHCQGNEIFFYKRAQLFTVDLYGALQGKDWGCFDDLDKLTAFADYKLPQVLRHLGIFCYADGLAQKVDGFNLIDPGSPEEVEIRANTIWAVELIRKELNRVGRRLKAFEIDWILWNLGQEEKYRAKPYHRTVTIFY